MWFILDRAQLANQQLLTTAVGAELIFVLTPSLNRFEGVN